MNKIIKLFNTKYPIIQGGMIWNSGWRLASAVSNCGGLGLIGSGSMDPELLEEHVYKCQKATDKPFGVNIPLLYKHADELIQVVIDKKVKIVFTSAGNPKKYTSVLKSHGIKVVHVVSSLKFAEKSEQAGVDAIVAEGFEAGGHNGIEETTTFCLIPKVVEHIKLPLIAAGGISTGKSILAVMLLGADGVQIGTRFALSKESSAHQNFKELALRTNEGDTKLTLKQLTPVRLIKNKFYDITNQKILEGASKEELISILGKGRSKKGMFEGDLEEGELEIGQVAALVDEILPVNKIFENILTEYYESKKKKNRLEF